MIPMRKYVSIAAILIVIRIVMYIGMIVGYPETYGHRGWYLHHGGDELSYITFAQHLARFELTDSHRTLGYPLFLVPFIWVFGANGFSDIMIPVTIVQACIVFPCSIVLVLLLAERMTGNRFIALVTAALWTLFPYLLKIFADLGIYLGTSDAEVLQARLIQTQVWMVHQMWAQVLSDPLSCFLNILGIFIFLRSLQVTEKKLVILTGVVSALAFLVRPQEAMLAVICFIMYAGLRRFRDSVIFCLSYGIVLLPQVLYNISIKGYFLFGYSSVIRDSYQVEFQRMQTMESIKLLRLDPQGEPPPVVSIKYAWGVLQILSQKIPFAPLFFGVLMGLVLVAFFYIYRVKKAYGVFFLLWIAAYPIFVASYANFYMDMPRLLMSIIPMFLLTAAIIISIICNRIFGGSRQKAGNT